MLFLKHDNKEMTAFTFIYRLFLKIKTKSRMCSGWSVWLSNGQWWVLSPSKAAADLLIEQETHCYVLVGSRNEF